MTAPRTAAFQPGQAEAMLRRRFDGWRYGAEWHEALDVVKAEAAALDPEALAAALRTTYDTVIHKGLMAYAVEAAWDASVSPLGDPEEGIEVHDLGVLAAGIVDWLIPRVAAAYAAALAKRSGGGAE